MFIFVSSATTSTDGKGWPVEVTGNKRLKSTFTPRWALSLYLGNCTIIPNANQSIRQITGETAESFEKEEEQEREGDDELLFEVLDEFE